jgi:hypothetical protein
MNTHTERSNAAHKAASRLMRSGLDCGRDLKSQEAIDWLADVAHHIGSLDRRARTHHAQQALPTVARLPAVIEHSPRCPATLAN